MTFKRMMVLGAMASALAFTGCQDRSRSEQDVGTGGAGDESQQQVPATGGSGRTDTIPGSTDTIGGTEQGSQGTDLGGTGAQGGSLDSPGSTGGSGSMDDQGSGTMDGTMDNDGTGGAGTVNEVPPSEPLDQSGTGGSSLEDDPVDDRGAEDRDIRQ